jgi:putative cell wall-binding protein
MAITKAKAAAPKKAVSKKSLIASEEAQTSVEMANTAPETILTMWGKSEKERNSDDLQMNFQLLQADAETSLIKAKAKVAHARKAYSDTMFAAAKTPNFNAIAAAALELEKEELTLNRAIATFSNLFGTTPSIAK